MLTARVPTDQLVEIACDESGAEGEKLIRGNTDVFAHASVRLNAESAADCIRQTRERIRSPAAEYKANHLLREKSRPVLKWLLGPSGPIYGAAHVQLTDKRFFLVSRLIDVLTADTGYPSDAGLPSDPQARAVAVTLYRESQPAIGRGQWDAFLQSINDLMRARNYPKLIPALDPLIPAIVQVVAYWSQDGRPVAIIHDEQTALTEERIAQLKEICNNPYSAIVRHSPQARLTSLRLANSASDPRVQVADFLAGVARKIASDELNDRGDAELTALLRPYVDHCSIWADERSWSLLTEG
jgi:hypothetical protein